MRAILYVIVVILTLAGCGDKKTVIVHGDLVLEFDSQMRSRISSKSKLATPLSKNFSNSEFLRTQHDSITIFNLRNISSGQVKDEMGEGEQWTLVGVAENASYNLEKIVRITVYNAFQDQAFFDVFYVNKGDKALPVIGWVNNHYQILPGQDSIPFWSFQGQTTAARKDWIFPLQAGFRQQNFMGMNSADYGGGIPVTDLWRRDIGIAIGHAATSPKLVSLPVVLNDSSEADVHLEEMYLTPHLLSKGDTLKTLATFVALHHGDCYNALKTYAKVLNAKGIVFPEPQEESFKPSWCAWGYMRNFTLDEIRGTIPKVKELGIEWVTIDDGYQQAEGDWHVTKSKFPKGDDQMRAFVKELHAQGMKVMLWWAPLAADSGSSLLQSSPDLKSLTQDGAPQQITWWDAYYMSPVYSKTKEHTTDVLDLFLRDWDVDGLKMDGQHLNAAPPDYNAVHHLESPEASYERLPEFFQMIQHETKKVKPNAIIQNCPCGTCMSVFNMPYMNQAVASDPLNSWQVRLKGKTYKAIIPKTAYFGDHVELSDGRDDFASSFGIGAVLGTKFTWPRENPTVTEKNLLTKEKEQIWKKWLTLYKKKMLSRAEYRGDLYDVGYDKPETHVVQKGDTLHYAFYSKVWQGEIELRGLRPGKYKVYDYVNDKDLGEVTADKPVIDVAFQNHLLIALHPLNDK